MVLAGIPMTPIARVAGAIVNAATDPDWETSGSTYSIPDDGTVLRIERQELAVGIYKILNDRVQSAIRYANFFTLLHYPSVSSFSQDGARIEPLCECDHGLVRAVWPLCRSDCVCGSYACILDNVEILFQWNLIHLLFSRK